MGTIAINEELCIGCSLCVNDCPNAYLYIENNKAHTRDVGCIRCGHCYAICPRNAITMTGINCPEDKVVSMSEIDTETLLSAMKSRRSVRHFEDRPVEEEKIQKILEAGRYAPTGGNAQNVSFTILGSKQKEAEEICVGIFREVQKTGLPGSPYSSFMKRVNITDDFFFKGAPLVIAVVSENSVNASIAASYMEIMAESLGLGVLYSGFFATCAKVSGKLRKLIGLKKKEKVVTCLIFGYPAVKYQRIVPRKPAKVRML